MDLSLEQRLLRFLEREEESERRQQDDLRALSVEDRVLEGECIDGAELVRRDEEGYLLRVAENLAKFREGDAVLVGDGLDFRGGSHLVYAGFDAETMLLRLAPDPFWRGPPPDLAPGSRYCIDRRSLNLRSRLHDAVHDAFTDPRIRAALAGTLSEPRHVEREERARQALAACALDDAQRRAGVAAIATESLALVQGPPGTGKTSLLAAVVTTLVRAGCRIALTAFTHRAVDNALFALRRLAPELALFKVVGGGEPSPELRAARITEVRAGRGKSTWPSKGVVVAGTCFQLLKLPPSERFHYAVFDEAGQLPIPHAFAGMLLSQRWLFFGDHEQLPPVITAEHQDRESATSIFAHLHALYGSALLDTTYRMNAGVCRVVSTLFYGGKVVPSPEAAARRLPFVPGGVLDEVLDPEQPVVIARVDHAQPGNRSSEEANLCADLVDEAIVRHRVPPEQIAVIAPFRAQVRAIRSALQKKATPGVEATVVDTVERIQGQERELVIVSLTAGDPESLNARAAFFFSTNRLNVSLSRARTKAIVVASEGAFAALPMDLASLRAASTFKRLRNLVPQVDLTAVYGARGSRPV